MFLEMVSIFSERFPLQPKLILGYVYLLVRIPKEGIKHGKIL